MIESIIIYTTLLICTTLAILSRTRKNRKIAQTKIEDNGFRLSFINNISHELRTPLSGIIGINDLILDTALTEMQRSCIETTQQSALSLLSTINNIIELSQIQNNKIKYRKQEFSLNTILESTIRASATTAAIKKISFTNNIESGDCKFLGDPDKVSTIIRNLLENSLKFTELGSVTLTAKTLPINSNKSKVIFEIKDTGIGIKNADILKIENLFNEKIMKSTRQYGGLGIGLKVSHELSRIIGGKIYFKSNQGNGSSFYLEIVLNRKDGN